ncbi:MAG: DNA-directed RNA polymerase subunit M [Lachnospiraceae bacterium]|nr:DNA-directed RNA polymerase subunit M [Lachnospiraceae bacterium]
MIRVFICPECGRTRMVSKLLKADCHCCGAAMNLCDIPYSRWVELDAEERKQISESWMYPEKNKYKHL